MNSNDSWRRPGFTVPGAAADAARKNHQLGTAHRFTSDTARDAGRRSWERRRAQLQPVRDKDHARL